MVGLGKEELATLLWRNMNKGTYMEI